MGGKPKKLLTSEDMNTIRRLNMDRSKRMERKVTQRLNGKRTPMSGAGNILKGDGYVTLPYKQGIVVLECKSSAGVTSTGESKIPFHTGWLSTLQANVLSMRDLGARFGMLVLKYHRMKEMFVLLLVDDVPVFERYYEVTLPLDTHYLDMRYVVDKAGNKKPRSTFDLRLRDSFALVNGVLDTRFGAYRVYRFETIEDACTKEFPDENI